MMGRAMNSAVIYAIRHRSGKQYVGSTARWAQRQREHRGRLRAGRHCNPHLQAAWAKYGEDAFEFVVLEIVADLNLLLIREQHWIDATQAYARGYNLLVQAGSRRGTPHSPQHRARISAAKAGHIHTEAAKELIREARAKQVMRPEAMAKTHAAVRGVPRSAEVRLRIAAAHAGKKLSEETKAKLRAANLGSKDSPETRARKSAALKAAWARKKAQASPQAQLPPPETA